VQLEEAPEGANDQRPKKDDETRKSSANMVAHPLHDGLDYSRTGYEEQLNVERAVAEELADGSARVGPDPQPGSGACGWECRQWRPIVVVLLPNGSRLSCGRLARRRKGGGRRPVPVRARHNGFL